MEKTYILKDMDLDTLKNLIRDKLALAPDFKAKVAFDLKGDGHIFVDATQTPPVIEEADRSDEADTTLICALPVFEGILNGTQDPNMAFMMGKLKVNGSMGTALKLNAVLED